MKKSWNNLKRINLTTVIFDLILTAALCLSAASLIAGSGISVLQKGDFMETVSTWFFRIFTINTSLLITLKILNKGRGWVKRDILSSLDEAITGEVEGIISESDAIQAKAFMETIYVHEAGHAVMAYLQDAYKYGISIFDGKEEVKPVKQFDEVGVKKRILIRYAGAAAEEILTGKLSLISLEGSNSDFKQAEDSIKTLIAMMEPDASKTLIDSFYSDKADQISKDLYSQCKAILSKNQDMIKDLMEAARLGNDSVSTNEVRRLFHKKGYEGRKRLYEIQ